MKRIGSLSTLRIILLMQGISSSSTQRALVNLAQPSAEINSNTNSATESVPQKVFKPEKYWKVVQPDEAIPRGLHVRINLQTGKKEAKLLDRSEQRLQKKIYPEDLKMYLKSMKNEGDNLNMTEKEKIRDMSSIQKEFRDFDLRPVKLESHTIQELLETFRNASLSLEDKQNSLKEMEYLLHQYDVAQDFVKRGGVRDLLSVLEDRTLRPDAALALGAALQGNPVVQAAALNARGVHSLLVALRDGCGPHCLFALSTLLRQFPKAQRSFLQEEGATILSKVFSEPDASQKLKVKVVTLLSDLLVERSQAVGAMQNDSRKTSYSEVDLLPSMVQAGFCEMIPRLLGSFSEDVREKVLHALHALVDHCKLDKLVPHLESLRSHYRFRMYEESTDVPDEYFEGLYKLADDLVKHITDVNHTHGEL
ncbi:nucleotide exchange factor SIL1-like isoform X2 [Varroa jacobsoni]|uniref:nucleotide exchange factor SIL1-like isoform X2 n=1 Tax=Varroa jacobsoni TaxID=62625 RepID=UPI000BF563C1|nr:nucleotide exchange factor SIL1-like isoform X2 [Varroa jacobsoni]